MSSPSRTGLKCLTTARISLAGDALHDNHAEILVYRGAIRWFLEEVGRCVGRGLDWIQGQWPSDSKSSLTTPSSFELGDDNHILMYISTVPCEFAKFPRIRPPDLTSLLSLVKAAIRGRQDGRKRQGQLFPLLRPTHQTGKGRFTTDFLHVLLRQDPVLERPRILGGTRVLLTPAALHLDHHR